MRVRTRRLLVKVVSGKRNYEQRSDGDAIIRGRKNIMDGFCMCINNTFCSRTKPPVEEEEEEEEEVGSSSSSARKINMLKEVVAHRLRTIVPEKKIVLGNKGEMTQKLGRSSFNCLVSRFSGMFIRLKKKEKKKKSGFRLMRKWKKIRMRKSSSVGEVKKRFARMKMMMRKECAESEEEEEEIELCKKRILMGEKCKPLNVSGSLHYDQNGVLLPELLLPCES